MDTIVWMMDRLYTHLRGLPMRKCIILVLLMACGAMADTVVLTDGSSMQGDVKRMGEEYRVTDAAGKVTMVPADKVRSLEMGKAVASDPDKAVESLFSLRRSLEAIGDVKLALERYGKFLEQYGKTPAAEEARKDMAAWQERMDQGLVKYGASWVTPAERGQLQEKSRAVVEQARGLMKEGRLKDADALLVQVLADDPRNVPALYLRGVLQFRQEQLPGARKNFEGVIASLPDHAATLNNLAVILWRQNQVGGALSYYDQAMVAAPNRREILDNVAEALNALPGEYKDSSTLKRILRHFTEQDKALQEAMARTGYYRWGGTWVNQKQLDELKAVEKEIKGQLDGLAKDFDDAKAKIEKIEDDIAANNRAIAQIEATSKYRLPDGSTAQAAYPPSYYQMKRDNDQLAQKRAGEIRKLDQLRAQAKAVQQKFPVPKFTGVQRVIESEGTPVMPPAKGEAPTSRPATRPTAASADQQK
ncbi:MAG TPA: tetratricopeptide repeat protein [Tepidisphaeraceae bacterium]